MDPFDHHHHHHHHHRPSGDDEDRRRPPPDFEAPPPPFSGEEYRRPPPDFEPHPPPFYGAEGEEYRRPPVQHVAHEGGYGYDRPPERFAQESGYYGGGDEGRHGYRPPHHDAPPFHSSGVQHVGHEVSPPFEDEDRRRKPQQQTYRIFTKADEGFSLSIRNGEVVLVRNDPDDEFQQWIKDLTYSTRVKDAEGFPAFALINKVTGEAIKHSIGQNHPVRLVKYNTDYLDESVLWAESKDVGDGFRCIRMVNNINLNFDAFNGDKDHGGVKDGTKVVLWEWWKGDNQKWKIVPH